MKTLNLIIDGQAETVQVERYFRALNSQYLIYSQDGADIDGNVRINVVKVENDQAAPINENEEWDAVKKVIVEIVNDNREMTKLSIEDLDYQILENLTVTESKALRLPSAIMPYLSANQPDFNTLEVKEQQLDEKVEALKDMNKDLTTMMDEVGKEFAEANNVSAAEEKLGATMEIIMPSKQIVAETKNKTPEEPKGKGGFNFKNLFGKKKSKVQEEETQPVEADVIAPVEQPIEIPLEPEIQNPVALEEINLSENTTPIMDDNFNNDKVMDLPVEPIQKEMEASIEPTGFDFFDTPATMEIPEPIVVEPKLEVTNEIPDIPNIPNVEEEPMEILELDEDKYKALYEEEQSKNAALEAQIQDLTENMKKLEETLSQYQEKLNQVKNIVD